MHLLLLLPAATLGVASFSLWGGYGLAILAAGVRGLYPAFAKSLFIRDVGKAVQVTGRMLVGAGFLIATVAGYVGVTGERITWPNGYLVLLGGIAAAIFQMTSFAAFGLTVKHRALIGPTALQDANIFVFALWPPAMVAWDFIMGNHGGKIVGPVLAILVCLGGVVTPMVVGTWGRGRQWRRILATLLISVPFLATYHAAIKAVASDGLTRIVTFAGVMGIGGILCLPIIIREERRARCRRRAQQLPSPYYSLTVWLLLGGSGAVVLGIGGIAIALSYCVLNLGQVGFILSFTPTMAAVLLKLFHPDEQVRPYHMMLLGATALGTILLGVDW